MDVHLADRMKQMILDPLINDARGWIVNDLLRPFDYRPPQGDEVVCVAKEDFPAVREWLDALDAPGTWNEFVRDEWIQRSLSGVFTILQFPSGAEPLIAFTKWSDALLLRRRGLTALLNRNRFELIDTSSSIYLPEAIDFFSYRGILFALDWGNVERTMSFREVTKASAVEHWDTFKGEVPVDAPEALWVVIEKSVRHQNTINRAFSMPGRLAPSMDRIESFIRDRGLTITVQNGQLVVNPADKEQVLHLITIIADGYVTSDITDRRLRTMEAEEYAAPITAAR
jgi:hypothetical protein